MKSAIISIITLLILAIIGCAILPLCIIDKWSWLLNGLSAGLFAVFFAWLINISREKANIEVNVNDEKSTFFEWGEEPILVIWARVSNLSSLPNSIIEITFDIPQYKTLFSSIDTEPRESYLLEKYNAGRIIKQKIFPVGKYQLKPIITLEPYKSVEGFIYFPDSHRLEKDTKGKLTIRTSRGAFSHNTIIKPYSIELDPNSSYSS